jgi:hypothetical protein
VELISSDVNPDELFLEPIQYIFREGGTDIVLSFIPTVPHGAEAEHLHGDLFDHRARDISFESIPVPVGSDAELALIGALQRFSDEQLTREQQEILRDAKFPKMDAEMVGWQRLLWFISALKARRERYHTTRLAR